MLVNSLKGLKAMRERANMGGKKAMRQAGAPLKSLVRLWQWRPVRGTPVDASWYRQSSTARSCRTSFIAITRIDSVQAKTGTTHLQTSLCAVRLLRLPRRVLGTTLSTDGLALSARHFD